MLQIGNPFPQFFDLEGALLDAGYIYIGIANGDPEVSPLQCYWDTALSIPATQPLRTRGGFIVNNGVPSGVYIAASDYSVRVKDADSNLVYYVKAAQAAAGNSYQPLDSDLTSISTQANQPFGLSLLTAATAAAGRALLAIGSYLATAGGTMTGNIVRSGAGPHLYHTDSTFGSGRILVTVAGAADPCTTDGDVWAELAP